MFGARALYPVAAGLLFAVALAVGWVRLSSRAPHVRRHGAARDTVEGDNVRVELEVEPTSTLPPPTLVAHEVPGRLGERRVELVRAARRRFTGSYELQRVPRGRYPFETVRLTVEDPFGLARAEIVQGEAQALVVYPRLVTLERPFSAGGARAQEGRRLLLRRPSGFDLHSVREHTPGESLRNVHWRSTAHRGQLMVKELEDAPRDETAVLLDGEAAAVVGEQPDSTFDVAARAAGSLLYAQVRRGRRCVLVVNSAAREVQPVTSEAGDWQRALEVLAAAEPTATTPAFALLESGVNPAARALELVVVTSRIDARLVDRLVQRALSRHGVSLVYVEPAGFAGRPARPEPLLLRLQAIGVPVAVVRRGADLSAALSAPEAQVA